MGNGKLSPKQNCIRMHTSTEIIKLSMCAQRPGTLNEETETGEWVCRRKIGMHTAHTCSPYWNACKMIISWMNMCGCQRIRSQSVSFSCCYLNSIKYYDQFHFPSNLILHFQPNEMNAFAYHRNHLSFSQFKYLHSFDHFVELRIFSRICESNGSVSVGLNLNWLFSFHPAMVDFWYVLLRVTIEDHFITWVIPLMNAIIHFRSIFAMLYMRMAELMGKCIVSVNMWNFYARIEWKLFGIFKFIWYCLILKSGNIKKGMNQRLWALHLQLHFYASCVMQYQPLLFLWFFTFHLFCSFIFVQCLHLQNPFFFGWKSVFLKISSPSLSREKLQ